ncbi:SusC/RagA family TonB-linked outer membrane protein [Thalassobellus suaedae]|uniref:TonB-dependent receptor n=1 Tax=Thalassobellus suaedae TaxID=3074124 RepID=A0ABY9Y7D3_9FLAO|nr:TonB-dependent receptor [Flavobacteriaceae bacterium HL-DH10]
MRNKITILICIVLCTLFSAPVQAQEKKVSGTILDTAGQPLPGVNIIIKGTQRGTSTDFDGNFSIRANEADILVISYLGFVTKEIAVKGKSTINVSLDSDTSDLDEVVLVSFGKQKKSSVIASISTIKPSELKIPSSNLTTALAGRVAGLISFQRGGEPGRDDASFFVRGVTTFGYGNGPLILIDGVELTVSDLRRIHPDDIAAFSIMKDASATALYGARGANGVIYVTLKEGIEGPARYSGRIEASFSSPTRNIELADPITYMRMGNEAVKTRDPLGLLIYSQEKIAKTAAGIDPILYPTTDWYRELFKNYTLNKRANFNVNGGGKVAKYYVAMSATQDNGILEVPKLNDFNNNVKFTQFNLRSNTNIDLSKTSKLNVKFNLAFDEYSGPVTPSGQSGGQYVYNLVMRSNPVLFRPFYEPDAANEFTNHILFGNYAEDDNTPSYINPFAEMAKGYQEGTTNKLIGQLEFIQNLKSVTEGLEFKGVFAATKESRYSINRAYNPYYYSPYQNPDTDEVILIPLNEEQGTEYLDFADGEKYVSSTTYLESRLTYNKTLNETHDFTGLLVYTLNHRLFSVTGGTLQDGLAFRNMGLAGRFTYGYDNRYFGEFNFGYNGSERFAKNERWGYFPSLGFGWLASNEKFLENNNAITNLKFKVTYGLVGNDAIGSRSDRFFYLSQVNLNDGNYTYPTGEAYDYRNGGISIGRYANDQITWETAKKLNLGIELGLFNDLTFEVDFFSEKREDILTDRIIPSTLGLQAGVRANVGEAKSQGIDGSLVYNKSFDSDFWLQARANFTYATNEITKIEEPDYSETPWLSRVGQPINQVWGLVAERLFVDQAEVNNSPEQSYGEYTGGDIKYKDINEDGRITELDRVPIGNPSVPEIVYGFGVSVGYKGFDLSCFFQGSANSSFWVNALATAPFYNGQQLLKVYADDYWSETNRNVFATWPRLSNSRIRNNDQTSTWFMQDGAFLRLKSAEIGYNLPDSFTKKLKMDKVRLYASGTNLFVLSNFKLWDPELAGNGLSYPNQKVLNLGLNVSF